MSPPIGRAVLALSGLGFPLTQLVIRRFGTPGAVAVEVVCGGLLVRDAAMIAVGVPGLLRRGPAVLLWLEAAVAGAAVVTGLRPVLDADALLRAAGQDRPDRLEAIRGSRSGRCSGYIPCGSAFTCNPIPGERTTNRKTHSILLRPDTSA